MPKQGERLPDLIDAKWWFGRGDSFLYAVRVLTSDIALLAPTIQAWGTCAAFCCECYMKILAQLERGEPPLAGHDLEMLAGDLASSSYKRIKRDWLAGYERNRFDPKDLPPGAPTDWARVKGDFEAALKESAKAFVDLRYNEPGQPMKWSLGTVPETLRQLILEQKPEWRPSVGPRVALNPQPDLAKAKDNQANRPTGWAILNR